MFWDSVKIVVILLAEFNFCAKQKGGNISLSMMLGRSVEFCNYEFQNTQRRKWTIRDNNYQWENIKNWETKNKVCSYQGIIY